MRHASEPAGDASAAGNRPGRHDAALQSHEWPGNVARQLRIRHRMASIHGAKADPQQPIRADMLPRTD